MWPILTLAWQLLSKRHSLSPIFFALRAKKGPQKNFLPQAAKELQIAFASPTDTAAAAAVAAAALVRMESVLGLVATGTPPPHTHPLASCAFIFLSSESTAEAHA